MMLTSSKESLASSSLLSSSEYLWCVANCNVHFADGVEDESQLMSRLFLAELNHEESLDGSQVSGNDISLVDCICSCRYVFT